MTTPILGALLLALGAIVVVSIYHFRMNRLPRGERKQVTDWKFYAFIDWYLQLSTLGLGVAGIITSHWLLFEVHNSQGVMWAGLAVAGVGLALFLAAMRNLNRQYTPGHAAHLPTEIVTSGPYRYIRHPVYTANLLMTGGVFLASGSLWLVANLIVLMVYYRFATHSEESSISAQFPEYGEYMKRTGRFFPRMFGRLGKPSGSLRNISRPSSLEAARSARRC